MENRTASTGRVDVRSLIADGRGRGARELSEVVRSALVDGDIRPGSVLPTIREVADAAGVSVGTVAAAWATLRDDGVIDTRRRGGTVVLPGAGRPRAIAPSTESAPHAAPVTRPFPGWHRIDLLLCSPDTTLQPPLRDALLASLDAPGLNDWGRDFMTDRLRSVVAPDWPFHAEAWATAGGGTEALMLATAAAAPRGSIVAVDEPVSPGYLDTLRDLGLTPIGVVADADGPLPESLDAALSGGAVAFVYQPGAPFAVGHRVTQERATALSGVLQAHPTVQIVEDDSVGPLAATPPPTLGDRFPDRVVTIRTYCKAFGTDLRTSVVGGSRSLIERVIAERSHGVASNSRILQNALAHLIADPSSAEVVSRARIVYRARRAALLDALEHVGLVAHSGPSSLVVWVEVPDETEALLALAGQGIAVGSGSKSFATPPAQGLLRISVAQLPDEPGLISQLADLIAGAARGTLREYFD